MKNLVIIGFILMSLGLMSQDILTVEFWDESNHKSHLFWSFILSGFTYVIVSTHPMYSYMSKLERRLYTFLMPMLFGALKEVADSQMIGHVASWGDIQANIVGIMVFQLVISVLNLNNRKVEKFRFY